MVAAHPIITTNASGPYRGTLVLGRYLNNDELSRIPKIPNTSLTSFKPDSYSTSTDKQALIELMQGNSIAITAPIRIPRTLSLGYSKVDDIFGETILILRLDAPRPLYEISHREGLYFMLSLMLFWITFHNGNLINS